MRAAIIETFAVLPVARWNGLSAVMLLAKVCAHFALRYSASVSASRVSALRTGPNRSLMRPLVWSWTVLLIVWRALSGFVKSVSRMPASKAEGRVCRYDCWMPYPFCAHTVSYCWRSALSAEIRCTVPESRAPTASANWSAGIVVCRALAIWASVCPFAPGISIVSTVARLFGEIMTFPSSPSATERKTSTPNAFTLGRGGAQDRRCPNGGAELNTPSRRSARISACVACGLDAGRAAPVSSGRG